MKNKYIEIENIVNTMWGTPKTQDQKIRELAYKLSLINPLSSPISNWKRAEYLLKNKLDQLYI